MQKIQITNITIFRHLFNKSIAWNFQTSLTFWQTKQLISTNADKIQYIYEAPWGFTQEITNPPENEEVITLEGQDTSTYCERKKSCSWFEKRELQS